jgi:hypothetical protein
MVLSDSIITLASNQNRPVRTASWRVQEVSTGGAIAALLHHKSRQDVEENKYGDTKHQIGGAPAEAGNQRFA